MQELKVFENNEFGQVRTAFIDGKPYFAAMDVAGVLGYANTRKAVIDHCKGVTKCDTLTKGGVQTLTFIPEGDIYRLIVRSKLPSAEKFEVWVFDEVLPEIRKTGGYNADNYMAAVPKTYAEALRLAADQQDKIEEQQRIIEQQAPKAEYFDALVDSSLLTGFRETAKELHIGQKQFMEFLLENKFIFRDGKGRPQPYMHHVPELFELKDKHNGKTKWSGVQTLITPRGKETFRILLDKQK